MSEINVTPLVDVMLVLLIVFMISAPLLNAGVPVVLPKAAVKPLKDQSDPVTITIRKDGAIFLKDQPSDLDSLAPYLKSLSPHSAEDPIYVRADGAARYQVVAEVMAKLSSEGFDRISLIMDSSLSSPGSRTSLKSIIAP